MTIRRHNPGFQRIFRAAFALTLVAAALGIAEARPQAAGAASIGPSLAQGSILPVGQSLTSSDGSYQAMMSTTGLAISHLSGSTWTQTWATPTLSGADHLGLSATGDPSIYNSSGTALWDAGVSPGPGRGLYLGTDGVLREFTYGWLVPWSSAAGATGATNSTFWVGSGIMSGQALMSPNGTYQASMQPNGNFGVYHFSGGTWTLTWSSGTAGYPGAYVVITLGQLAIFDAGGTIRWASGSNGVSGQVVGMQDDGNLILVGSSTVWTSQTGLLPAPPPPPPPPPPVNDLGTSLAQTQTIGLGQWLQSPDGSYKAMLSATGLAISHLSGSTWTQTWATPTLSGADHLGLSATGDPSIYNSSGTALWDAGVSPGPGRGLYLGTDGVLRDFTYGWLVPWSSAAGATGLTTSALPQAAKMLVGQSLVSPDGNSQATLTATGLVVAHFAGGTWTQTWSSGAVPGTASLGFSASGDPTISNAASTAIWDAKVSPGAGRGFYLGNDGVLDEFTLGWLVPWSSAAGITGVTTNTITQSTRVFLGQSIVSTDGSYQATLQATGLAISHLSGSTWTQTWTTGILSGAASLGFSASGDLTVYGASGNPLWDAKVSPGPGRGMNLGSNGVLTEFTLGWLVPWSSVGGGTGATNATFWVGAGIFSGQSLVSPNGTYQATMQPGGDFTVSHFSGGTWTQTWHTNTGGNTGAYLVITVGQLAVFNTAGTIIWNSGTHGLSGQVAGMQDDGNFILAGSYGVTWSSQTGLLAGIPNTVGVYAYGDTGANGAALALSDGWGIIGETGGLGTAADPWVDTSSATDLGTGKAIQAAGGTGAHPWLSFWTASGPGCSTTNSLWYYIAGLDAGAAVAHKIDTYAGQGLGIKPNYVIFDPEGYPDYHSGLDCGSGAGQTANFQSMIEGWYHGLVSVDPSLHPAFYATQYEYNTYGLATVHALAGDGGALVPAFLAVAFAYWGGGAGSGALSNPVPIGGIPFGPAQVASSNLKGIIAFFADASPTPGTDPIPFSLECGQYTAKYAQFLASWGTPLNTLQFDPGTNCKL